MDLRKPKLHWAHVNESASPAVCTYVQKKKPEKGEILDLSEALQPAELCSVEGREAYRPVTSASPYIIDEDFSEERIFHIERKEPTGLVVARDNFWGPRTCPDQQAAEGYWAEVQRLQKSPAGKKATDLLKEFLNEQQRGEIDKKGYFNERLFSKWQLTALKQHGCVYTAKKFDGVVQYHIDDTYIFYYFESDRYVGICWHPEEPIPQADIVLSHLLHVREHGIREYLDETNW